MPSDSKSWLRRRAERALIKGLTRAYSTVRVDPENNHTYLWPRIALLSFLPAVLFGWTLEWIPIDSFTPGTWLRSIVFAATAAIGPAACAAASMAQAAITIRDRLLRGAIATCHIGSWRGSVGWAKAATAPQMRCGLDPPCPRGPSADRVGTAGRALRSTATPWRPLPTLRSPDFFTRSTEPSPA